MDLNNVLSNIQTEIELLEDNEVKDGTYIKYNSWESMKERVLQIIAKYNQNTKKTE